jgi:hypothetical protein
VAAVAFAFGSRPGVPEGDALELADLLSATRTLAGNSSAAKIREQARKDPDRGETSEDVQLSVNEREVLAAVLEEEPWPRQQEWFGHLRDELAQARGGLTTYRIRLGTAPDAAIIEHQAQAGSLHIGDELYLDGVMRTIHRLAPFESGRNADFMAVLAVPPVVLTLGAEHVELYRSELAQLRPEIARLADTRPPAAAFLATVEAVLEADEAGLRVTDDELAVLAEALLALEVSGDLSERLRFVWNAVRDYLRPQPQA